MSAVRATTSIERVESQVHAKLAESSLTLKPRSVRAKRTVDGLDEEAWQLQIFLPRPDGSTWDREEVFTVRRTAIAAFDAIVEELGMALPGQTLASVTTDQADESDIAIDEAAEAGEDPLEGHT